MKKTRCSDCKLLGMAFVSIVGTLFHFIFDWLNRPTALKFLFATNESIFQHTKLFLVPFLLWAIPEWYFFERSSNTFLLSKLLSSLFGILFITAAFYTYSGFLGFDIVIIDMAIFYAAVILSFLVDSKIRENYLVNKNGTKILATAGLVFLAIAYVILSYYPPQIAFFISG